MAASRRVSVIRRHLSSDGGHAPAVSTIPVPRPAPRMPGGAGLALFRGRERDYRRVVEMHEAPGAIVLRRHEGGAGMEFAGSRWRNGHRGLHEADHDVGPDEPKLRQRELVAASLIHRVEHELMAGADLGPSGELSAMNMGKGGVLGEGLGEAGAVAGIPRRFHPLYHRADGLFVRAHDDSLPLAA